MGKSQPQPPERDPEVRKLLRRAVHGLRKPIIEALDAAPKPVTNGLTVHVHLGLHWWARWLADAEIALGDSE